VDVDVDLGMDVNVDLGINVDAGGRTRPRSSAFLGPPAEMRYCEISKEMSSLYFGLAIFCLFEARVSEFDTQPPPPPCTVHCTHGVRFWHSSFKLAEYIKTEIQRRHLLADLIIPHLWLSD
jgi:hypothetical protein